MKRIALAVAVALAPACAHSQHVTRQQATKAAAEVGLVVGVVMLAAMTGANQCNPDASAPCFTR